MQILQHEGLTTIDELLPDTAQQIVHRDKLLATILDSTLNHLSSERKQPPKPPELEEIAALEYASALPPDAIVWPWLRLMVGSEFPALLEDKKGRTSRWQRLRRRLNGLRLIADLHDSANTNNPTGTVRSGRMHRLNAAVIWKRLSDSRQACLLYTSPSPRDGLLSRMPSSA